MVNTLIFIIGAMFGSAANALIDRLPRNESWFAGRSHCDKCKHVLEWYDLVPVASYISLKGRCRYCHSPIPWRNMLVEVMMGAGFVLVFQLHSFPVAQLLMGILWVTVIIAVMDWETKLVSEVMILIWGVLVLVYQFASLPVAQLNWTSYLVGLVVSIGVIGGLWAVSRGKAMGFGDVEIATVMGWWLGWPKIIPALWIAFVVGAIIGVIKLIKRSSDLKSEIAFGPFLVLGAWAGWMWGDVLWHAIGIR